MFACNVLACVNNRLYLIKSRLSEIKCFEHKNMTRTKQFIVRLFFLVNIQVFVNIITTDTTCNVTLYKKQPRRLGELSSVCYQR